MDSHPPKWANRILSFICSDRYIDELQGDLYEMYYRNQVAYGSRKANLRFIIEVLLAFRFYRFRSSKDSYYHPNRMDIFKLNLKLSYRQLVGSKLYSFINILGLTIGFAAFIAIYFWRQNELNTDRFHTNAENTYLLTIQTDSTVDHVQARYGSLAKKVGPKYSAVQNYTEISDITVYLRNPVSTIKVKANAIAVHPGFLRMFDFKLLDHVGDSLMSEPNTIILTQKLADKLFDKQDPIGKLVNLEYNHDDPYKVVGVMENVPDNSSFEFECLVPQNERGWGRMSFGFVQLYPDRDLNEFGEKIKEESRGIYSNTITKTLVRPFPFTEIYFNSDFKWFSHGNYAQIEILGIVALLILLVSIINYVNLASAQARARVKEVGLKKLTGASRKSIFAQFYMESIFMVFISFCIAVFVVELIKPQLYLISGKAFDISYLESGFLVKLSMGLFIVFFISGLYPATYLSSFNPIKAIKGSIPVGNGKIRHTTVVVQYCICIILLIGTMVLQKQIRFVQSKDLGFDRESVVGFEFFNEDFWPDQNDREVYKNKRTFILDELDKSSLIEAVGSSEFPIYDGAMDCWGFDADPDRKVQLYVGGACTNFLSIYDIELVEGRFFGDRIPSGSQKLANSETATKGVIINRTAAKELLSDDAVGKVFTMSSWGMVEVIGVVDDFNFEHLSMPVKPLVLYGTGRGSQVVVRFAKGKLSEGMKFVQNLHKEVDTGVPFTYDFLDQQLGKLYEKDMAITRLMSVLTIIALVIASLGLFALSAYMVDRRVKEIGIRKVNGANTANIFTMLSRDFLKWVILAAIVAMPVSWYFMDYWLRNYAYRTDISWWIFVVAGLVTVVLSWITVSYHTSRASITNPVDVLRNE